MSSVVRRPRETESPEASRAVQPGLSTPRGPVRARRQPRWIAAGLLAMCLGGLGAVVVHDQATTQQSVVMVNRAVARGELVRAGDLGVVQVGTLPGVQTVPADQAPALVGKQAIVDLSPGLLPAGSVGEVSLPSGRVQLGLKLAAGRIPARDLVPGSRVLLISVPATSERPGTEEQAQVVVPAVVVSRPTPAVDQASYLVEVHVARTDAEEVAALAAQDRIVLVHEA